MADARSIRCSRCGAAIPLATALSAPCRSCGHTEPVPPELAEELRRYEAQHAASLQDANASLQKAQSLETTAGQIPAANTIFKLFGVVLGFALLAGAGVQFVLMDASFSSEAKANMMMLFPVVVMGAWLGVPIYLGVRRARTKASSIGAQQIRVACPTCGADNALMTGDTTAACAYCGARLVPSATAVMRALDASAMAERAAGMAEMRAQRAMTLRLRQAGVNPGVMVFGSFGMVFILGLGGFLVEAVSEGDVRTVVTVSLLMSVVAAPLLAYYTWRHRRRTRWTSPVMDLTHQFLGRYSTKLEDQVAWLNAYWSMTYSEYWIVGAGLRFGTIQAEVAGYPVLVDLHPDKPYGSAKYAESFEPRLNILVAVQIPPHSQSQARMSDETKVHVHAINDMGFVLQLSSSGILARASGDALADFTRQPETLHRLSQTLQSLALLAAQLGPPAAPIQ